VTTATARSAAGQGPHRLARLFLLGMCLWMISGTLPAAAHFRLNLNVRILHVEHLSEGLRVYLRTPMPYLVADRIGPPDASGLPTPAPFTTSRMEDGKPAHYVDPDALRTDPEGLGRLAADGLLLTVDGDRLDARVLKVRVSPIGSQPDFATLAEATAAFDRPAIYPDGAEAAYVGDSVVDIILAYASDEPIYDYALSSTLDPGLPGQEDTANLILDYSPGETKIFRARGLLTEPVVISHARWSAFATFIEEGFRHILSGWDHILFVLCLALGATRLHALVVRATGFTLGHSVTLIAGFFGLVPAGAWFIPAVEMGIALSIIYAAVIALQPVDVKRRSERGLFVITAAIGLLHGLGFSFVLHEILQINSPNIWQSLVAFNVGIEFGQLVIIAVAWPLFLLIRYAGRLPWLIGRWGIASACSLVALFWTGQRALAVLATF
jgi:hypothetical protein